MNLKIWKRNRRSMHYRNLTNRKIITGLLAIGVSITPRLDKNGKPYINPKWRKN